MAHGSSPVLWQCTFFNSKFENTILSSNMAQSQQTYSTLTFCIFQLIKTLVEKTKNWPFMQGDIQLNYTTCKKKVKGEKNSKVLSSKTILVETDHY